MGVLVLTLSYDGTEFFGSQAQTGRRTVQRELARSIEGLFDEPTRVTVAGRTDRGVHAAGQVACCRDLRPSLDDGRLKLALNARLPDDLRVVKAIRRTDGFNPRYDALWREYRYRIWSGTPQPLARRFSWRVPGPIDVAAMQQAASRFVGDHDFASFAGSGKGVPWSAMQQKRHGTRRCVLVSSVSEIEPWWMDQESADGQLLELRVAANGFLPQMARTMAGTLVKIGLGVHPPDWIDEVLSAHDRRWAPAPAPPHGLTLWRVGFAQDDEAGDLLGALEGRLLQTVIRN